MRRHLVLIAFLSLLGMLVTLFGPCAAKFLLGDLPAQFRGMREMARRERYREEHPDEPRLGVREPEVILHAAAARAVRVYRLNPRADSACVGRETEACFQGHRVIGRVAIPGTDWDEHFLAEVMRMATEHGSDRLAPRFGIRFIGTADTTDLLLDTTDSLGIAVLVFQWKDSSGRRRRTTAHMPYPFEGDPDADSTLRALRRVAPRL